MNESHSPEATLHRVFAMTRLTSQQIAQLLILGLPAGLIITGVIAMLVYFRVG